MQKDDTGCGSLNTNRPTRLLFLQMKWPKKKHLFPGLDWVRLERNTLVFFLLERPKDNNPPLVLGTAHLTKHFHIRYFIQFTPHNQPVRWASLSAFHAWGNWGSDGGDDLREFTPGNLAEQGFERRPLAAQRPCLSTSITATSETSSDVGIRPRGTVCFPVLSLSSTVERTGESWDSEFSPSAQAGVEGLSLFTPSAQRASLA